MMNPRGVFFSPCLQRAFFSQSTGSMRCCLPRIQSRSCHITRFNSTSSVPKVPLKTPARYPERLLIYHAGTGRTVFIGCLKVTTIFVFGFFCLVVAPARYFALGEPAWISGIVLLSGLIPVIFVSYTTAPFVSYVHLRLPPFARISCENVLRYSKFLPRNATLEITTMNLVGKPQVSRVEAADLYAVNRRFSLTNFVRSTTGKDTKRPWWAMRPIKEFAILGDFGRTRVDGVWENVAKSIKRFNRVSPRKF